MKKTAMARVTLAALVLASVASLARANPLPQRVLSRGAVGHARTAPLATAPHTISGAIVAMKANALGLKLRSGRVQSVDANAAVASGRYSAPLFIGKLVVVTGTFDARRVFHADTITRVPRVDALTPADR